MLYSGINIHPVACQQLETAVSQCYLQVHLYENIYSMVAVTECFLYVDGWIFVNLAHDKLWGLLVQDLPCHFSPVLDTKK